jgi:hypothetical protein
MAVFETRKYDADSIYVYGGVRIGQKRPECTSEASYKGLNHLILKL